MYIARFALVLAAAASLVACESSSTNQDIGHHDEDQRTLVQASVSADEAFLGDVQSVRTDVFLSCDTGAACIGSGTDVRVIEVGSPFGDPAANGMGVVVNFTLGGDSYTFDTGLDIIGVTGVDAVVEADGYERVFIDVMETYFDEQTGQLGSIENTYFLTVDATDLSDTSIFNTDLLPDDSAETVLAHTTDERYGLVPALWNVHREGESLRLIEVAAGDPAYNGTHVFAVMTADEVRVWNTGINVRSIDGAAFTGPTSFEVITTADVPLSDGSMVTGPMVYPASFELDESGIGDLLRVDLNPPAG